MTVDYQLKHRHGFFAAGTEFSRALSVLGDGAFKLFAHVCLEADRATGQLVFERTALARRLGKSRSALGRHLHELVCAGVCELETAPNQHRGSVLVVRAAYWPYRARQAESPIQRPRPTSSKSGGRSSAPLACRRTSARPTSVLPPLGSPRGYRCKRSSTPSCSAACASRCR